MKVFIDTTKWVNVREERAIPTLVGNNYVDKIEVYYNSNPATDKFYPSLNILKSNGRRLSDIGFDSVNPTYPRTFIDDDNVTWYYFVFTLSSERGQLDVTGQYQISITTNFYDNNTITAQRNINTILNVKNAVKSSNGKVLIFSDNPADDVVDVKNEINNLKTSSANLSANKADKNNPEQTIIAEQVNANGFKQNGNDVLDETDIVDNLNTIDSSKPLSAKQGKVLNDEVDTRVKTSDIVDNLTSDEGTKPLSAKQGKVLNDEVDSRVKIADIINALNDTSTNKPLSAYQGKLLKDAIDGINTLLQSDDTNLDELQEIVAYIKNNKSLIDGITSSKISFTDIIDNLTSELANNPLSAKQGFILKGLIDALTTLANGNKDKLDTIATGATKVESSSTNGDIKINGTETNVYTLPKAAAGSLGGVMIGSYISIDANGVISVDLASASQNGAITKELYSVLKTIADFTLTFEYDSTTTTYTNVPDMIDAIYNYIQNLNDEVAALEGSDTSFTDTLTAIQNSLNSLINKWDTFMAGTDADNITDTLLSVQTDIVNIKSDIDKLESELSDARINASGIGYSIDTISDTYGLIKKIGGMSYKSENLLNFTDIAETTTNGITYKVENGVITINGTATAETSIVLGLSNIPINTTVTSILTSFNSGNFTYFNATYTIPGQYWYQSGFTNKTFVTDGNITTLRYVIPNGSVLTNTILRPMLVLGTTAPTEYKPYFEGIRDSAVTSVVSKGANLANGTITESKAYSTIGDTYNSNSTNIMSLIEVKPNTTYSKNNDLWINYYNSERAFISQGNGAYTFTTPSNCYYVGITIPKSNPNLMLNKGSTALPYEPYKISTYQISELQTPNRGINADCYNYIDFERKVSVYKVGRVDLGSLNYTKFEVTEGNLYRASLPSNSIYNTQNCLCAKYEVVTRTTRLNKKYYINNESGGATSTVGTLVDIVDNDYSTASDFKNAMSGVYLYYELATPTELDISAYLNLDALKLFKNGSVTFENTYKSDVPYSFEYATTLRDLIMLNYENDKNQQNSIDSLKDSLANTNSILNSLRTNVSMNIVKDGSGVIIFDNGGALNNNEYLSTGSSEIVYNANLLYVLCKFSITTTSDIAHTFSEGEGIIKFTLPDNISSLKGGYRSKNSNGIYTFFVDYTEAKVIGIQESANYKDTVGVRLISKSSSSGYSSAKEFEVVFDAQKTFSNTANCWAEFIIPINRR